MNPTPLILEYFTLFVVHVFFHKALHFTKTVCRSVIGKWCSVIPEEA